MSYGTTESPLQLGVEDAAIVRIVSVRDELFTLHDMMNAKETTAPEREIIVRRIQELSQQLSSVFPDGEQQADGLISYVKELFHEIRNVFRMLVRRKSDRS